MRSIRLGEGLPLQVGAPVADLAFPSIDDISIEVATEASRGLHDSSIRT